MKTKKYVKTAVAGMSALTIGAVSMIPTTSVMAAGNMDEAEIQALLESEAEKRRKRQHHRNLPRKQLLKIIMYCILPTAVLPIRQWYLIRIQKRWDFCSPA